METAELNRYNVRRQTLKLIEHLREARQKLALAGEHLTFITGNAPGLAGVATLCEEMRPNFDALYAHLDRYYNVAIALTHEIKAIMDNPNAVPPPIMGRYLAYTDRTPLQRALIREGYEAIAKSSHSAIPETYYENSDEYLTKKPAKIVSTHQPKIKYKPRPKRRDMPI